MFKINIINLFKSYKINFFIFRRGLTLNPNSFGPLANFPDYSFKDGRPVPYGINQKRKIEKNREYAVGIV